MLTRMDKTSDFAFIENNIWKLFIIQKEPSSNYLLLARMLSKHMPCNINDEYVRNEINSILFYVLMFNTKLGIKKKRARGDITWL